MPGVGLMGANTAGRQGLGSCPGKGRLAAPSLFGALGPLSVRPGNQRVARVQQGFVSWAFEITVHRAPIWRSVGSAPRAPNQGPSESGCDLFFLSCLRPWHTQESTVVHGHMTSPGHKGGAWGGGERDIMHSLLQSRSWNAPSSRRLAPHPTHHEELEAMPLGAKLRNDSM